LVAGHTPPTVGCETGERGSGLYPDPLAVRTRCGRGVAPGGEALLATICSAGLRSENVGGLARALRRDAGEPPLYVPCGGFLRVGRGAGSGKRAVRETHFPDGPQVLPAHWLRAAGRRTSTLHSAAVPSLGTRWETLGQSRWVLRAEGSTPRFLRRETLEKPEIEDEYRHIARLDGRGFGPFGRKCLIYFDGTSTEP